MNCYEVYLNRDGTCQRIMPTRNHKSFDEVFKSFSKPFFDKRVNLLICFTNKVNNKDFRFLLSFN